LEEHYHSNDQDQFEQVFLDVLTSEQIGKNEKIMGVTQNNVKGHRQSDPHKGRFCRHKNREVVEFIAEEKQPKAEVQPENPIP
tara:strand:- start:796 stop:1044 length:249 start_codon:yes stop_codon:yes gene_type:complete